MDGRKLLSIAAIGVGTFAVYKAVAKGSMPSTFIPNKLIPSTSWRSELSKFTGEPIDPNWIRANVDPELRWNPIIKDFEFSPKGKNALLRDYLVPIALDIKNNIKCPDGFADCGAVVSNQTIKLPNSNTSFVIDYKVCGSTLTFEDIKARGQTLKSNFDLQTSVSPIGADGTPLPESDYLDIYRSVLLIPRIRPSYTDKQFWTGEKVYGNLLDPDWALLIDHINFTLDMLNDDSDYPCIGYIDSQGTPNPSLNAIWEPQATSGGNIRVLRSSILSLQRNKLLNTPREATLPVKAVI